MLLKFWKPRNKLITEHQNNCFVSFLFRFILFTKLKAWRISQFFVVVVLLNVTLSLNYDVKPWKCKPQTIFRWLVVSDVFGVIWATDDDKDCIFLKNTLIFIFFSQREEQKIFVITFVISLFGLCSIQIDISTFPCKTTFRN